MTELAKVDAHTARSVAGRIRQGIRDYLTSLALVKRAWDEEHWRALGYDSWQGYVDGEFGAERLGLPVEHRDKALNDLRLAGMSVRAIAAVTGVPKSSVADEMRRLSGAGQLEQPERILSLDGRERPATRPQTPATSPEPGPASTSAGPGHNHAEGTQPVSTPVEAGDQLVDAMAEAIDQAIERAAQQKADRDALCAPREVVDAANAATHFVPAMVRIQSGCEDLLHRVNGIDPERAVTDLPEQWRDRLKVARDAHAYLSRVVDALDRIGVPA